MNGQSITPEDGNEDTYSSAAVTGFQASLAQFAYTPTTTASRDVRRSIRRSVSHKALEGPPKAIADPASPRSKRPSIMLGGVGSSSLPTFASEPKRPHKKQKRGFADSHKYAHLQGLQDYLKDELDGAMHRPSYRPTVS